MDGSRSATELLRRGFAMLLVAFLLATTLLLVRFQVSKARYTVAKEDHYVNVAAARDFFFASGLARRAAGVTDVVTTGLPVLLPVGAAMRVIGLNPVVPRLTMVALVWAWGLIALIALWPYGSRGLLVGAASLVTLVPITLRMSDRIDLWSCVFGEVPAFLGVLAAFALLARSDARPAVSGIAGLLLGLAIASKLIVLLTLPAAVCFMAYRCLTEEQAAHHAAVFAAGLVAVMVVVGVARLILAGGVAGFIAYFQRFLPGSYTYQSAGLAPSGEAGEVLGHAGPRMTELASCLGGWTSVILGGLLLAMAAVCTVWRAHASRERRLAFLLLFGAAPILIHYVFIDPFGWIRRAVPVLGLVGAGGASLVSACPSRVWRVLFAGWMMTACVLLRHDWARLVGVPRGPQPAFLEFRRAAQAVQNVARRRPKLAVRSPQYGVRAMFQSVTPFEFRYAPYTPGGPVRGIWLLDMNRAGAWTSEEPGCRRLPLNGRFAVVVCRQKPS